MQHLPRHRWCSSPTILLIVLLFASCATKTEIDTGANDTTAMNEDTAAVGDDYASAELEDAWANGPTGGDGRPPQGGVGVYQAIWMSKAFDDEFNRTRNVDSAMEVHELPIVYFDFTGGQAYLGLFDFTTYLANGGPSEQLFWSSFDELEPETRLSANIQRGDKNPRGYTRLEMVRKNDYDADADGVMDDLETLDMNLYRGGEMVDSHRYFKTYRSPDEIAHTIQLTGTYADAQGGVYSFEQSDSRPPDRYIQCSNYLATQECWSYTLFRMTTPEITFDYVLQADEAGNDYVMMGEDAGFAYSRQGDSLTVWAREGIFKLVKTK